MGALKNYALQRGRAKARYISLKKPEVKGGRDLRWQVVHGDEEKVELTTWIEDSRRTMASRAKPLIGEPKARPIGAEETTCT